MSNEDKTININSIKTIVATDSYNSIRNPLHITGVKDNSTFIGMVADESKKELDSKNSQIIKNRGYPYIKRDYILTQAEKKLYKFLKSRLPNNIEIFCKIRLADIIDVNSSQKNDELFYKIAYKRLDYVILDEDLNLICVVELGGYRYKSDKTKARDKFVEEVLKNCGIKFFVVDTAINLLDKQHTKYIEFCVLDYLAPYCKECGRKMEALEDSRSNEIIYACTGRYERGENRCKNTCSITN